MKANHLHVSPHTAFISTPAPGQFTHNTTQHNTTQHTTQHTTGSQLEHFSIPLLITLYSSTIIPLHSTSHPSSLPLLLHFSTSPTPLYPPLHSTPLHQAPSSSCYASHTSLCKTPCLAGPSFALFLPDIPLVPCSSHLARFPLLRPQNAGSQPRTQLVSTIISLCSTSQPVCPTGALT